ncbi:MAG: ORF6N domain-containing protein [Chitinophagaceae bacterium]
MAKTSTRIQLFTPDERIINKIYLLRGQKVMLDEDLAELYGVENKQLKRQVRRNIDRFPDDFMFELSIEELENLRSQIGTTSWGGSRYVPMAFTEQGVSMLSGVLNSSTAIQVHIQIIRIFNKMRENLLTNKDILLKLEILEKNVSGNKKDIAIIFEALKNLLSPPPSQPRKRIGFKPD